MAVAPVPERMQYTPRLPVLFVVSAKDPVGLIAVPGDVSVTVTVQLDVLLTSTGVEHETDVVVVRLLTVTFAGVEEELAVCVSLGI